MALQRNKHPAYRIFRQSNVSTECEKPTHPLSLKRKTCARTIHQISKINVDGRAANVNKAVLENESDSDKEKPHDMAAILTSPKQNSLEMLSADSSNACTSMTTLNTECGSCTEYLCIHSSNGGRNSRTWDDSQTRRNGSMESHALAVHDLNLPGFITSFIGTLRAVLRVAFIGGGSVIGQGYWRALSASIELPRTSVEHQKGMTTCRWLSTLKPRSLSSLPWGKYHHGRVGEFYDLHALTCHCIPDLKQGTVKQA